MSPLIRRGAIVGMVAGLAYAAWKYLAQRTPDTGGVSYRAQPFPMPPRPIPATATATPTATTSAPASVEPDAGGNCPVTHPIKGKRSSGIFHRPGSFAYERTHADACYADPAAAEHDGLRAAKR
ncbi:MAG: hypothetical protein ABJC79_02650 [Acidimicrobiia bacterium]